jgi:hypothetical protein
MRSAPVNSDLLRCGPPQSWLTRASRAQRLGSSSVTQGRDPVLRVSPGACALGPADYHCMPLLFGSSLQLLPRWTGPGTLRHLGEDLRPHVPGEPRAGWSLDIGCAFEPGRARADVR